jgi:hypothetical protein
MSKAARKRSNKKEIVINPKWDLFIEKYTERDFKDAAGAYEEAFGCSRDSAYVGYKRLLRSQKFQEHFAEKISSSIGDSIFGIDLRIVKMYVTRAFYDIADILDARGDLVAPLSELSKKGLSCVIVDIDKRIDRDGNEHIVYKLADRDKALLMLKDYMEIVNRVKPQKQDDPGSGGGPSARVYVVQRRTVEEWRAYYETDLSGYHNQDRETPSAIPLSSSSLEEPREEENLISF